MILTGRRRYALLRDENAHLKQQASQVALDLRRANDRRRAESAARKQTEAAAAEAAAAKAAAEEHQEKERTGRVVRGCHCAT